MSQHASLPISQFSYTSSAHSHIGKGLNNGQEALSECVISQKQSKLKEKKILEAVKAYRAEKAKLGTQKGVCVIAKEHGIGKCNKTIINR